MKRKLLIFSLIFFAFALQPLFAEIVLLSPVEGQWSNKQMLVIDNSAGGEYFYSVDGADPAAFGFAYDGPVLLDVTGDVKLTLAHISSDGKKEISTVRYSVVPDEAVKTDYHDFVQTFFESGILNYSAGSDIVIPSGLFFCLGLPPLNYLQGCTIRLSEKSVLSRYLPCTVIDKKRNKNFRFIIKTFPQSAGIYSKRDLPFEISDWETIIFRDQDFIYKVDSEYWGLPTEPRKLDRSVSHMISWQPLEYDPANPVEFFVLPPRPEIVRSVNDDDSIVYSIKGDDSYTLSILNNGMDSSELFTEIGIDAFYGDRVSGNLELGVFSNAVYQGKFDVSYMIDKKPPELPVFESSADSFCSRDSVQLKISVPHGAELYIALSQPLTLAESENGYSENDAVFKNIPLGGYKKVKGETYTLNWSQNGLNPVYYKVAAYSKRGDNTTLPVEYAVVIDQSNYYFDASCDPEKADGTILHPFTDFKQVAGSLVKQRVVKLRVRGKLDINEAYPVEANFELQNAGDAQLNFGPRGSLNVKASTIEISNCRIHNETDNSVKSIIPLIKLENSVLTLKDCVIGADFNKNGTVIDSFNSIVNITDTMASANAVSYVSFISAVKSRLSFKNSSINTNADTSVVISADGGSINALNNEFMISGGTGRIAELFGVKAAFKNNTFKARLTNAKTKILPLYADKAATLTDEKNIRQGF